MSDTVLGIVILIPFLIAVFIAGYLLYKFKNRRLTAAWGPLVGLVNGTVSGDGGGAATSWLTGVWKGRAVAASLSPGLNQHEDGGAKYNYFDVALRDVPGKHDWSVEYTRRVIGIGQTGWQVRADNPALEEALRAAGVAALVAPFGETPSHFQRPSLEYNRLTRLLRYRMDVSPAVTPTPQRFTELLEMLLRAEEINRQKNPTAEK